MSEVRAREHALRPSQRERRQRILDAAMEIASRGGYDALNMKDVAAHAKVSLGTLYRYFGSKDHLLAETLLVWGGALGQRLRSNPARAESAAERVGSVFRRMARGVERQPELGVAITRAMHSTDEKAFANREDLIAMMSGWIDGAIGDEPVADREGVISILQQVCFGSMTKLATGRATPKQVGDELERAARLLLQR